MENKNMYLFLEQISRSITDVAWCGHRKSRERDKIVEENKVNLLFTSTLIYELLEDDDMYNLLYKNRDKIFKMYEDTEEYVSDAK